MKNNSKMIFPIALMLVIGGFVGLVAINSDDASAADPLPADAIPVTNAVDLSRIGTGIEFGGNEWTMDAYYYLPHDITLTGTNNFVVIGNDSNPFTGTLDGRNNTIKGMNIDGIVPNAGLFRTVDGATIKDLTLDGLSYTITANNTRVGAFVAYVLSDSSLTMSGCYLINSSITVTSSVSYSYVGGLVGRIDTSNVTISDSFSTATITVTSNASNVRTGGLIGEAANVTLTDSYNTGNVTVTSNGTSIPVTGGLIGNCTAPTINRCFNGGNVTINISFDNPATSRTGGIAGSMAAAGVITNTYNTGNITNNNDSTERATTAGIVAYVSGTQNAKMINCYNTGMIIQNTPNDLTNRASGIVGQLQTTASATLVNCYCLADSMIQNGNVLIDRISQGGDVALDGTSTPERLSIQVSGAKTSAQMKPLLSVAQAGVSVFYAGSTVTAASGTFTGFDFVNTWSVDPAKNNGFPFLVNSPQLQGNGGGSGGEDKDPAGALTENMLLIGLLIFGAVLIGAYALGFRSMLMLLAGIAAVLLSLVMAYTGVIPYVDLK